MRIAYVLPGSGDTFYCQNCVRDVTLVKALREQGHDVVIVPLYLPLFSDGQEITDNAPVFFGGLSTYLQQKYELFRKTPRWLDRILDSKLLLRSLAKHSGSTRAADLGDMTISMLRGEDGNQRKEVLRLIEWLRDAIKPDIVHLSTALLLGIVPALRRELDVNVICSLQDEDTWIDAMQQDDSKEVWRLMSELGRSTDAFVAASNYYAALMRERLKVPEVKMYMVYPGIPVNEYSAAGSPPPVPTVGYMSRLSMALGFNLIVDAFLALKARPGLERARLRVTGGRTKEDRDAAAAAVVRIREAGFGADVDFVWDMDRASRVGFLQSLSVLSVPSARGEAFGLHMVEALACGVPAVQPRAGAYAELIDVTGGGILCEPGSVDSLADALAGMLCDPGAAAAMGAKGREAAGRIFSTEAVVRAMLELYERLQRRSMPGVP